MRSSGFPNSVHAMHVGDTNEKAPRREPAGLLMDGEPRLQGDGNPSPSTRLDNAERRSRVPIGWWIKKWLSNRRRGEETYCAGATGKEPHGRAGAERIAQVAAGGKRLCYRQPPVRVPPLWAAGAVPRSALRGAARLGEWVDRHSDLSTAIQHPGFPVHWPCRLLRRGFSLAFPWASATIVINDSHCSTPCAYIANQRNVADEPAQSAAPLKAERAKGAGLSVRQRLPLLLR